MMPCTGVASTRREPVQTVINHATRMERSMTSHRITVELPPGLDAPAYARAIVAEHGVGLAPELVADAVLCVSEVVTNAVQYGRPAITLCLDTARGGLGVEVTDRGVPFDVDAIEPVDDVSPNGRGLHIVAALSRAWGVRPGEASDDGPGKTVWFELHPGPDVRPAAAGPTA